MPKRKLKDISVVKPVELKENAEDLLPIKGIDLFPENGLYGNLFLAAKTNSGKTTVVAHMLKHTIDKRTTVYLFCSTYDLDPIWKEIIDNLEQRKIHVVPFHGVWDDTGRVNILEQVIKEIAKVETEDKPEPKERRHFLQGSGAIPIVQVVERKTEKKPKNRVPKNLIILDDLNIQELRDPVLCNVLKKCRHYKTRCIVSSQHLLHLTPQSFGQLSTLLLWGGFSEHYITELWSRCNLGSIDAKQLFAIYQELTKKPHSFLNISLRSGKLRIEFKKEPLNVEELFSK